MSFRKLSILSLVAVAACSASESGGQGAVTFTTYGENYIESEIPAEDVADGWTIAYRKFLVSIEDVTVGSVGKMSGAKLFSMKTPGDQPVVTFSGIPAGPHAQVSYAIGPVTTETELTEGVTAADKEAMVRGGYSIYLEASASKGATTKTFTWGFTTHTAYTRCKAELAGKETDGVVVPNGGTDSVQLTIHGDHFYYDDLQSQEAKVRFDTIASADANDDGTITLDELAGVRLAAIPSDKGTYGTGSAAGINDLRAFVEALSRTVGHYRGEGECISSAK